MDKRQFTGKTLEEAISEAARAFSTDKDLLCYNVIQQPSGGIFSRLFARSVRIEAWVETVKEDLQAAAREVVRQTLGKTSASKPNLSPISSSVKKESEELTTKNENNPNIQNRKPFLRSETMSNRSILTIQSDGVKELFDNYNKLFFAAFGVSIDNTEVIIQNNEAIVRVFDEGIEKYLSKSDKLSLAFEHVFKRVAQKKLGDISSRISLDAGESSEKREERLIGMAKSLAEKVRKTGKSVILSSKSSQERRVIHLALDVVAGVATRSVGAGDKRRLVIYSTEKRAAPKNNHSVHSHFGNSNKVNPSEKPHSSHSSKFKKKSHKKRSPHHVSPKQNAERLGATTSTLESDDEEMKQVSNKRQSYLIKED
jgi:spoIIIJ-associated protein